MSYLDQRFSRQVQCIAGALLMASIPTFGQQMTGTPGSPNATTTIDGRYVPAPPQQFTGEIGLNPLQSKPGWPARVGWFQVNAIRRGYEFVL